MKFQRRETIRRFADEIRKSLQLSAPVNVEQAVQRLGGKIVRFKRGADRPEAYVKGLAGKDAFEIGISKGMSKKRYPFSVAHEIAHLFLHMGFLTDRWNRQDQYLDSVMYRHGYSNEEAEAHEFAGTLLMPEADFRAKVRDLQKRGTVNLDQLADHFGVSPDAIRIRGRYLGVFDWK